MRVEVLPSDESNCLVTFASPGERAGTVKKAGTKHKHENRETSGFQISTSIYCLDRHGFYSVEQAENNLHLDCNDDRCEVFVSKQAAIP
jgi:hypothetical protein